MLSPMEKERLRFDVVILGSGLAGMRAAYSACKEDGELRIGIITLKEGPSGSSFCNFNGRLGMQVPVEDREKELFYERAISIGGGGIVEEELLKIEVEEAEERFLELVEMGVRFEQGRNKGFARYSGCFLPEIKTAVIIEDLKGCFWRYYERVKDRVTFLGDCAVVDIVVHEGQVAGVLALDRKKGKVLEIGARCVVCAFGGGASLFPWTISWDSPFGGYGLALLKRAGVKLVNTSFVQMLWAKREDLGFFPVHTLLCEDFSIGIGNRTVTLPSSLHPLAHKRATHCPIGYGLEDFLIDEFLLRALTIEGVLIKGRETTFSLIPVTQALNGGAHICSRAMTNIMGLFACGECASGMHGANRIGGGMVLASQVFGHRAGRFAAKMTKERGFLSDKIFTNLMNETMMGLRKWGESYSSLKVRCPILEVIRGLLGGEGPGREVLSFIEEARERGDIFCVLKAESLGIILGDVAVVPGK